MDLRESGRWKRLLLHAGQAGLLAAVYFAAAKASLLLAIPPGYEAQVRPRSGLALRHGLTLPNTPATIDSDYRGELMVAVINLGAEPVAVARGTRIAQLVFQRVEDIELRVLDDDVLVAPRVIDRLEVLDVLFVVRLAVGRRPGSACADRPRSAYRRVVPWRPSCGEGNSELSRRAMALVQTCC